MPFIFKVPPGGFLPPREAHLVLTPLLNSTSFAVNLLCADEYLFHMRVDFPNPNGADERVGESFTIIPVGNPPYLI